jgi:hypothetical protein
MVVFKPMNVEDFTDNISVERSIVVKYFEEGDAVRIMEGKY